jgi:hypothetical protein
MLKNVLLLCGWLVGAAIFSKSWAQNADLRDWTALSEENAKTPVTDTVFLGKSCVKLDGRSVAAIWNKKVNFKNFRMEVDTAGGR